MHNCLRTGKYFGKEKEEEEMRERDMVGKRERESGRENRKDREKEESERMCVRETWCHLISKCTGLFFLSEHNK